MAKNNRRSIKLLQCVAAGMMFAGVCKAESRITVPEVESVKILIDGKEGADEWESVFTAM